MEKNWDDEKIAEDVLALLYFTAHRESDGFPWRTWKGHDWDALDLLHKKGLISDPKSKAKSVLFSDEGFERAKRLAEKKYSLPIKGV